MLNTKTKARPDVPSYAAVAADAQYASVGESTDPRWLTRREISTFARGKRFGST